MPFEVDNALVFSQRAINFDKHGNVEAAIYYYNEAAKYLEAAISKESGTEEVSKWRNVLVKYKERKLALEEMVNKRKESDSAQSESEQILQRCNFLFSQALDADERGHKDIALELYRQTAEFALSKAPECDEEVQSKLRVRATQAIERGEEIKGISHAKSNTAATVSSSVRGEHNQRPALHRGSSAHLKISGGSTVLSDEEKKVLLITSRINSIDYVPFMDIDLKERFQYALPFSDKDGSLKLSPKQKLDFAKWARPEEIHNQPRMIHSHGVDYYSIKQTIISDCSFVASLAVSALYERKFAKKLITPIIYPRNKNKEPIYNPFGKYMVKLHINGVPRKIVIDDTLPVGRHGELLCSYSTNKGEMWISILEKAYMKVMGGYDFPGSNSVSEFLLPPSPGTFTNIQPPTLSPGAEMILVNDTYGCVNGSTKGKIGAFFEVQLKEVIFDSFGQGMAVTVGECWEYEVITEEEGKLDGNRFENWAVTLLQNIDLHALTGWIPERIAIRKNEADFNSTAVFSMLEERLRNGHCLGTVATGTLSDYEAERSGLVPTHAYAILDVRTVKNLRLMLLKNPWSHVRWRGNYSELDVGHWTPELRAALNYDLESAAMFDNGIFWIDYDSILNFFDVFYINWNPELFSYTYCIHQMWQAGVGPAKDVYNIGDNPQFRLHIPGSKSGSVWVLLTRHITDVEDFKDNQEFITVLVYKNNGNRVYYPRDPEPYIDGVRINSPHYLCKVLLNESSDRTYTLVISQYEKMNNIYYTLRAYSTLPFTLNKIESSWPFTRQVNGQWAGSTAGGCANHPNTYPNNPCFQFKLESPHSNNNVLIDLKGPRQYQIGFDVICVHSADSSAFTRKSSGSYRSGFVILELDTVPPGTYNIIPSTYYPGSEGPFILTVKSTTAFSLTKIR